MDPNIAPKKDLPAVIYEGFAKKSRLIVTLFHLFYYFLILFYLISAYFILTDRQYYDFFYQLGKHFGQFALALFGLVVLPGILGRFKIEIKLTRLITLFRRQLGITVFIFAFIHYSFVRLLPQIAGILPFRIFATLFETLGTLALFILFWLFLTSNNFSMKKLGKWWKRLHRFVCLTVCVLVFHTTLNKISIWTIGITTMAILEVGSFVWEYIKKKAEDLNEIGGTTGGGSDGNGGHSQNADISRST